MFSLGADRYTPSCLRSLVEWRQKIRWIDKPGFVPNVHFIGCAPNRDVCWLDPWKPSYVGAPKPSSRKKSWYQGRFARTDNRKGDHKSGKDQEQKKARQDKQNQRERLTKGGKNKKRATKRVVEAGASDQEKFNELYADVPEGDY